MIKTANRVVITGASSGFGERAVRAFADRGCRVWGTMRDTTGRNAGKKLALQAHAPSVSIIEMDVANDASVADGFTTILAEGPVDILINNAGIMYIGLTEAFSIAQAREQMETNYFGAARAMHAVLPSMRAAGSGLIINTSSLVGRASHRPSSAAIRPPNTRWRAIPKPCATKSRPSGSTSRLSSPALSVPAF